MTFKKLKAGSLTITVIIAVVIGLFSLLLILTGYYNRSYYISYKADISLRQNISSAVNLVLADTTGFANEKKDTIDLFGLSTDTVIIIRNNWGLYNIGHVEALVSRWRKQQIFLYGAGNPDFMDACLYMADHKRPVSLVGNTFLKGNVYLSKSGINISYIDQRGFKYNNLVNGIIKTSKENLPALNKERIDYLYSLKKLSDKPIEPRNEFRLIQGENGIIQSFADTLLTVSSMGYLSLIDKQIKGRVMVISDSCIEIGTNTDLENILIIAPVVKIQPGFKGSVQIIASEEIDIADNCFLQYPSSIVLVKNAGDNQQRTITIGAASRVQGLVFSYASSEDLSKTQVILQKETLIEGLIYASGYTHFKGTVHGTIATDYFLYSSGATTYENHLVDVTIDRSKLFPFFVNSSLFAGADRNFIIQRL